MELMLIPGNSVIYFYVQFHPFKRDQDFKMEALTLTTISSAHKFCALKLSWYGLIVNYSS